MCHSEVKLDRREGTVSSPAQVTAQDAYGNRADMRRAATRGLVQPDTVTDGPSR